MTKILPFQTLRGRLTLLACVATLPAFMFVAYVAFQERGAALGRVEAESRHAADLASREHALQVLGARRLLERLATLAPPDQVGLGDLPKLLPVILRGFPQVANLGVLRPDGELLFSAVPPPRQVNLAGVPAFQRALSTRGVAVGTYLLGPIVERPILIMAKAVRDARGQVALVLFAALDLAWLDRLAKQARLPPESALLIVDREGAIVASSVGHQRANLTNQPLGCFRQLILTPNSMTRCTAPDGVARLAVAIPLKGIDDLWVVAGPPEANVHDLVNRIFYRDFAGLALFAVFAIISSLVATDLSVLRDLRLLAAATRRFGKGELSVRAPVPRPDGEIRDLTTAFNAMADKLELRDRQAVQSQERLRALSHRLSTAREEEAARIAQEMHDELGQELSVLRLELDGLRRKMAGAAPQPEQLETLIEQLGERIDAAVRSVRRIASELRPGVLDRLGLAAGLEWLLSEFERRSGIRTTLVTGGVGSKVDVDVSTALFRITQEALANVARHSGATCVQTSLTGTDHGLLLRVKDNGKGFDSTAEPHTPSLGLLGMRERARRLGGAVHIASAPQQGTELQVTIPLDPSRADEGKS